MNESDGLVKITYLDLALKFLIVIPWTLKPHVEPARYHWAVGYFFLNFDFKIFFNVWINKIINIKLLRLS